MVEMLRNSSDVIASGKIVPHRLREHTQSRISIDNSTTAAHGIKA